MYNDLIKVISIAPGIFPNRIVNKIKSKPIKASQQITRDFLALLEKQFPIESRHPIQIRKASQFASHLNIHVNHLNRAIRETLNKTTTQVISEHILQEAKILLRNSNSSIADIGFALGFTEPTHFNNFFRKHARISPTKHRLG